MVESEVFASEVLHEREVKLRSGKSLHVFLQEMSEAQQRFRGNLVMDPVTGRGKGGGGIRLDRQRLYDFKSSVKDWDFLDTGGQKLSINEEAFNRLSGSIGNQIAEHIRELNDLPDDMPEETDDKGNVTQEEQENPTSES